MKLSKTTKRVIKGILIFIALSPVTIIGLFIYAIVGVDMTGNEKFVREEWLKPVTDINSCTRGQMAQDLVDNHLSIGMPREQVLQLLGSPREPSNEQGDPYYKEDDYYIGFCTGALDPNSVIVRYDAKGNMVRSYVTQH